MRHCLYYWVSARGGLTGLHSLHFSALLDASGFIAWYQLTISPESPADVHRDGIVVHCNAACNGLHSEVPQVSWGQSVLDHPLWRWSWEEAKLLGTLFSWPRPVPSHLSDPP